MSSLEPIPDARATLCIFVSLLALSISGCPSIIFTDESPVNEMDTGTDAGSDVALDSGEDPGNDAAADSSVDAGTDAGPPDAGPEDAGTDGGPTCIDTGSEVCDGIDNDCNGTIDDGCRCRGQWLWENPDVPPVSLNDVWTNAEGTYQIVVGDHGTYIWRETGDNNYLQLTPLGNYVGLAVKPTGGGFPDRVWTVSEQGTILESIVGGFTEYDRSPNKLYDVDEDGAGDAFVVGEGGVYRSTSGFVAEATLDGSDVTSVWANSSSSVFFSTANNNIYNYNGSTYSLQGMPSSDTSLQRLWGSHALNLFAVGGPGSTTGYHIHHYVTSSWSLEASVMGSESYYGVDGYEPSMVDVMAVGASGRIDRTTNNGSSWSNITGGGAPSTDLRGISRVTSGGDAGDAYIVGAQGTFVHYDGMTHTFTDLRETVTDQHLFSVSGSAYNDVIAVGNGGTIVRYDGSNWVEDATPTMDGLNGTFVRGPTEVAVGGDETVLVFGSGWNDEGLSFGATTGTNDVWVSPTDKIYAVATGTPARMFTNASGSWVDISITDLGGGPVAIFGFDDNNIFVSGFNGRVVRWDGSMWSDVRISATSSQVFDLWGTSASDLYAVADEDVYHYNGSTWTIVSGIPGSTGLRSIWGVDDSVFVAGNSGRIARFDGSTWHDESISIGPDLLGVWASSENNVFVVGIDGYILHHCGDW